MLTLHKLKNNLNKVKTGLMVKNYKDLNIIDRILEIDDQRRNTQKKLDDLLAESNAISKQIGMMYREGKSAEADALKLKTTTIKSQTDELSSELKNTESMIQDLLVQLPNIPHETVPNGKSADDNQVVRTWGVPPTLSPEAKPHWELAKDYDLFDLELGVKLTGSGFPVFKGMGAKMQRALIQLFLDHNTNAGYQEVVPPLLVNEDSAFATGQLPDKEGQMYVIQEERPLFLIPTSEVPVTNIYRDSIIAESQLPIKATAYSQCFRREAGSYGKDVRGLNRVHQFDKVEIVQLTKPEHSYDTLEEMLTHVELLLQKLGLHYRVLLLCGGDMSFTSAKTYDLEVYSAAQDRWLEVSSVSNFEDYQTNRLKARYKDEHGKTQLLHSLNGSSLALPRIFAAIIENFQTPEGIIVPEVLRPFMGTEIIVRK